MSHRLQEERGKNRRRSAAHILLFFMPLFKYKHANTDWRRFKNSANVQLMSAGCRDRLQVSAHQHRPDRFLNLLQNILSNQTRSSNSCSVSPPRWWRWRWRCISPPHWAFISAGHREDNDFRMSTARHTRGRVPAGPSVLRARAATGPMHRREPDI